MPNKSKNLLNARRNGDYILPNGELEKNTRYTGGRNSNITVLGASGTGKTYGYIAPTVLSGSGGSSMIISDTKGTLHGLCKEPLEEMGYDVILLDYIDPAASEGHYNFLEHPETPNDIQKLSNMIAYLGLKKEAVRDPFWLQNEVMFLNSVLGYLMEEEKGFGRTVDGLFRLMMTFDADALANGKPCDASRVFERHKEIYKKRTGKDSWAYRQFKKFVGLSDKTFSTVLISAYADLCSFDTPEMCEMASQSDFDVLSIAEKKTAVFINVSDTDRSKDTAVNIFYTQVMDKLCRYADSLPEKHLPVPVRFILDDFGTAAKIEGFEGMISNIRSRGISVALVLQTIAQLEQGYGTGAKTILANCSTKLYMGGSDPDTANYVSSLTNKMTETILNMPLMTHWLIRQGAPPSFGKTVLLHEYELDERKYAEQEHF